MNNIYNINEINISILTPTLICVGEEEKGAVNLANYYVDIGCDVDLMETMEMGLLLVSTYHSGIPELIEHGVSGFLGQENNVDELVDNILKTFNLSFSAKELLIKNARKAIEDNFNNKFDFIK